MSGGYFNYMDSQLKSEVFGWSDQWWNAFEDQAISELVWDIFDLMHDFDWYKSGDTMKETYLRAKADFKKKWMDNRGVRVRRIVDEALQRTKDELYETFNIKEDAEDAKFN